MAGVSERPRKDGTTAYRVEWRDGGTRSGERCWETFDTATEAAAFKALVDLNGQHWPDGWVKGHGWDTPAEEPDLPTVEEWCERAVAARTRASERTKADYRRDLRRWLYPRLGPLRVDKVGWEEAAGWVTWLQAQGLAPKTGKNIHSTVSTCFDQAVRADLVRRNPFAGLWETVPGVKAEEMVFLTPQEFWLLLSGVSDHYRPLVLCLALTGLRWGEATALQWHDVDLLTGRLRVVRAWKRPPSGPMVLGEPKTRKARRTVSLPAELVDVLVPLSVDASPDGFVFTTRGGSYVSHNNFYNRVWKPLVDRLNDPDLDPALRLGKRPRIHDLRHSHASWLIDAGVPLPAIQARLGHESIQTTVDRYGHLMTDADDRAAAALPTVLVSSGA